jgi:hypothetical protein
MKNLALVAAFALLMLLPQDSNIYIRSDGEPCPPEGSAKDLPHKTLNEHKNRFTAPAVSDIDPQATLKAMLDPPLENEPSDEHRFNPKKGATITGYVIDAKPGGCQRRANGKGGESCNCNATVQVDCDTHIEVALSDDPQTPGTQRVIVEVTPRFRKLMRSQGKDWSTDALKHDLAGHWVQFTGWLLFDFEHTGEAENSSPGNPSNWRATCWEIHPVTSLTILAERPATIQPIVRADLLARQTTRAQKVQANPQLKKLIDARNQAFHVLYSEEE